MPHSHGHHGHNHSHGHHHHHHGDPSEMGERALFWAVTANVILTLGQTIGGIIAGSLSLLADALHNFSDAASLLLAMVAIRIGRKPADIHKTFGYKRAETIAALINLTTLIIIGLYLVGQAVHRFIDPQPIEGWIIVIMAGLGLVVNSITALLTFRLSKDSMNIRAAFLHNLTDAFASVAVIVAGTLILLFGWVWTDAAMTLIIAGYVLWQGLTEMLKVIHLLMEGTPDHINISEITAEMEDSDGVKNVHHVHIWQLDEHRSAMEAHVVLEEGSDMDAVKQALKSLLHDQYDIEHSTLEFEWRVCGDDCGHDHD